MRPWLRKSIWLLVVLAGPACIDYKMDPNWFPSFFAPEAMGLDPAFKSFFYSPLQSGYDTQGFEYEWIENDPAEPPAEKTADSLHIQAWANWLGFGFSNREVARVLWERKETPADTRRWQQRHPRLWKTVLLLRDFEDEANLRSDPWQENKPEGPTDASALQQAFEAEPEPFLKGRLAFSLLRAACVDRDLSKARGPFQFLSRNQAARDLWGRAWGWMGRVYPEDSAVYAYARQFLEPPHDLAIQSIEFRGFQGIDKSLALCQNPKEKAAVLTLMSLVPRRDNLDRIRQLAELEPESPWIRLAISREINRNEVYFRSENILEEFWPRTREDSLRILEQHAGTGAYFLKLAMFCEQMGKKSSPQNAPYWHLALAYLCDLQNLEKDAWAYLDQAEAAGQNAGLPPIWKKQVANQRLLILGKRKGRPEPEEEIQLLRYLKEIEADSLFYLAEGRLTAVLHLSRRFQANETLESGFWSCRSKEKRDPELDRIKSLTLRLLSTRQYPFHQSRDPWELWHHVNATSINELSDTTTSGEFRELIQFLEADRKSVLDKEWQRLLRPSLPELRVRLCRRYLEEGKFTEARDWIGRHPDVGKDLNPWMEPRWGPFDVNMANGKGPQVKDEAHFLRMLPELEKQARLPGKQGYEACMALGAASVNISYFGPWWFMTHAGWSVNDRYPDRLYWMEYFSSWKPSEASSRHFLANNYMTTQRGLYWYGQAFNKAESREEKAKAAYLAAVCESISGTSRYLVEFGDLEYGEEPKGARKVALEKIDYSPWMKTFRELSPGTRFHDTMLKTCDTYCDLFEPELRVKSRQDMIESW